MVKEYRIGQLTLGTTPRVVGTLSTRESLPSAYPTDDYTCDVVEVRLDKIGPGTRGWMKDCQAMEAAGFPVVLTLRLADEGGKWKEADEKRQPILSAAMESLASIDVELKSKLCVPLCRQAQELGKCIIVSTHNFKRTPGFRDLKGVLDRILDIPCAIPKISTMIAEDADVRTLRRLLETDSPRPVCIVGMGSKGTKTRVLFPSLGSCLAYGYLDSPCAPGQLPSSMLIQYMRQLLPEYNQDVIIRKEIMEFV
jgi:3-dehydroquinate dehydratase-1